jgi:WD40 repeat protein
LKQKASQQKAWCQPLYMAPELFGGTPAQKTDLYGLGAIAYELLTGHPPFEGTYEELQEKHASAIVPGINRRGLRVSQAVNDTVLKALEKNPADRQASAALFSTSLSNGARLTVVDTGIEAVTLASYTNIQGVCISLSWSSDGKKLALYENALESELVVWLPSTKSVVRTMREEVHGTSVAWMKDNTYLISYIRSRNALHVWDTATGTLVHEIQDFPYKMAFSFDHQQVIDWSLSDKFSIRTLLSKDAPHEIEMRTTLNSIEAGCFSPNGQQVAIAYKWYATDTYRQVSIYDIQSKKEIWSKILYYYNYAGERETSFSFRQLLWSPDTSKIAVIASDVIFILDAHTGNVISQLASDYWGDTPFAWASDSRTLIGTGLNEGPNKYNHIIVWDAETMKELYTYQEHTAPVTAIACSPYGTIASASEDKTVRVWRITNEGNAEVMSPVEEEYEEYDIEDVMPDEEAYEERYDYDYLERDNPHLDI